MSLLHDPQFRRFFAAGVVSQLGNGVGSVALPLTAVSVLGASAMDMGILGAVAQLPVLLFALHAGVFVDRLPRRPIMVATNLGRGVLVAIIPAAALAGVLRIQVLWAVAFAAGVLAVVFDLAVTSYPPSLVARDRLVDANAILTAGGNAANIAGPAVAGWLVRAIGAPIAVAVDAVSFLAAGVLQSGLREPKAERPPRRRVRTEIAEGMRTVWDDRVLRAMVIATTFGSFAGAMDAAVHVLFAVRHVGASAPVLGIVFSVGSAAGLGASVVAGRVARRLSPGGALLAGQCAYTLGTIAMIGAPRGTIGVALLVVRQALCVGGLTLFSVTQISLRQAITPPRLLGRVNATRRVTVFGVIPIGALLGGFLGSTFGLRAALAAAIVVNVATVVLVAASPLRTAREAVPST